MDLDSGDPPTITVPVYGNRPFSVFINVVFPAPWKCMKVISDREQINLMG